VKKAPVKTTPMMEQYLAIKQQAREATRTTSKDGSSTEDAILFYRMGDFYEMFFDDAIAAASALDIALTKRGKHSGADIPMCGVPVHAAETYLHRLIKRGFGSRSANRQKTQKYLKNAAIKPCFAAKLSGS
jgi:DNA mismatch repair protein MutS